VSQQPAGRFYGTDIEQRLEPGHLGIPDMPPGEHLWTMMLVHRIDNPASWARPDASSDPRRLVLGMSNLMQHHGPLCLICEELWTPEVEARPCPGDPSDG